MGRCDIPMNKAFLREPDEPDVLHCPRCGAIGQPVGPAVIAAHLRAGERNPLNASSCFCPGGSCEVAYFDSFGQTIAAATLNRAVYPKHPDAPVCACFRLKAIDIEADAEAGNPAGIRELIRLSQTPRARCAELAAGGICCVPEVQRIYLKAAARKATK